MNSPVERWLAETHGRRRVWADVAIRRLSYEGRPLGPGTFIDEVVLAVLTMTDDQRAEIATEAESQCKSDE